MDSRHSERGFTLLEVLMSTAISLIVIGTALTAFMDGVALNDIATQSADSSHSLRSGATLLVRDFMQAGRGIPTGGISIPAVSGGAAGIKRPGPTGTAYYFDNTTSTTLSAVTTGKDLGPLVNGQRTDIVTLLMVDSILDEFASQPLQINVPTAAGNVAKVATDGSSFDVGPNTGWITGDQLNGRNPVKPGDLMLFTSPTGNTAIQTVTRVASPNVYFDANDPKDQFNLNQRTVTAGSITQILGTVLTVQRVLMYTYFVDTDDTGVPRLMRALNYAGPQSLVGVVEDLELSYDIVDGVTNPTNVRDLPYTAAGITYTANLIRKANVHIGVRSESISAKQHDYLRNHLSTTVSLRNLAFVDRYK
jgi:prepilin-type N-terminal cleavage/methylation domain-containing protein